MRPAIDEHFRAATVEEIVESLRRESRPDFQAWAASTAETLGRRSPTMLKVTLEQVRRGRTLDLAECFRMELGLVHGCFEQGDFAEGIRALIVEKDNRPRWQPAALRDVTEDSVRRFFAPRWKATEHPLAGLAP